MKLDWAMLADAAQVREGLAFVIGGGIDTINTQQLPAVFNATILIRLLLHRTETDREHTLQVRITDEDGDPLAQVNAGFTTAEPEDIPVGWDIPMMFALNIQGLELKQFGRYAVDVLADELHLSTLNLRVKPSEQLARL